MLCGFKTLSSWLLPALAVLAILGGPSQSAASALLQVELKERQETEQTERPTQTDPATEQTKKEDAEDSFGSFVVIKAAKPADGPVVKATLEWAAYQPFDSQKKPQLPGLFSYVVVHSTALHHPAYHAHAPPRPGS